MKPVVIAAFFRAPTASQRILLDGCIALIPLIVEEINK
jgi:hypothetical protein